MAPPNFPQGMTLHSIGFAALKYPELPSDCPVPLSNQIGLLQRQQPSDLNHMVAQIASQYLPALIEYQCGDEPLLQNKASSQYYFSSVLCLINFLFTDPDVCVRVAQHPTLLNNTIEKMLDPDFETGMQAADRSVPRPFQPPTFDSDFGTLFQFISTSLLHIDHQNIHPRTSELIPKLNIWKNKYKRSPVKTISNAAERLVGQINGMEPSVISMMRDLQKSSLVCGQKSCRKQDGLIACGACRIQRYCGKEHQKADWKFHKRICLKGLEDLQQTAE